MSNRGSKHRASAARGRFGVAAVCALLATVPSAGFAAGFALGKIGTGVSLPMARSGFVRFTPASVDPRMAQWLARSGNAAGNGKARLLRFTPAGVSGRASRMTVAVRVDDASPHVVAVNSAIAAAKETAMTAAAPAELRLAPTRYNLGLAHGYQSFAKTAALAPLSRTLSDAAIPDLATYRPTGGAREDVSRFAPRNSVSEPRAAAAPRIIDQHAPLEDPAVDVAGSYRLTHNIDVTAGVRYMSERERLAPIADTGKKDNQAVYVGTQFRF